MFLGCYICHVLLQTVKIKVIPVDTFDVIFLLGSLFADKVLCEDV